MAKNRMSKDVCDRCGAERPLVPSGSAIGLVQPWYRYWMTWRHDLGCLVSFCGRCNDEADIFTWLPAEQSMF